MEGEIDKALNKDQSEQDLFQSAIGCTIDSAFEDICQIKKIWHKEKGVQGFHLVQSFAPGEISPELAHQIGVEFADRLEENKNMLTYLDVSRILFSVGISGGVCHREQ